jgi:predicted transcriptional regulator
MSTKLSREEIREMLWDMVKNQAKIQIFNVFDIYGRMSLTELAERLHKSKSTISTHLKFMLKLGVLIKERVPLDSNANVFENYYEITENIDEIFRAIDYEYKPFQKLSRDQIEKMIEPAIAMNNWMKSFYDTNIKYWEVLRDSGIDEEPVESINRTFKWVKNRDGDPVMLAHQGFSFNFYAEKEFYKERGRLYKLDKYKNIDWEAVLDENKTESHIEKPLLIINTTMPYGHYIEYLNKQKKKSYQT